LFLPYLHDYLLPLRAGALQVITTLRHVYAVGG